jgi:DNA-binding response OmpR family regulator
MQKPSILIVDDEKDTRNTLNNYLCNRIECDITEAEDGYQAIEKLKSTNFDLILLDIKMPGISGTDVIKEAKKIAPAISVIVITRWDSAEVSDQVKEAGADYIPKPFSLKVVRSKVEEKLRAIGKFSVKK